MPAHVQLIVGLGNPGSEYERTRHNVGAWFVDKLAAESSINLRNETKFHGLIARLEGYSKPCWLLKPSTYMNESGKSVSAVTRFYKIPAENVLVVHDELDFDAGIIRFKSGGGHGGHNGLRDVESHLHTRDFQRLRIGIGHPGHRDRVTPYVLSAPSRGDQTLIMGAIEDGITAVDDLIDGNFQRAFRFLHNE